MMNFVIFIVLANVILTASFYLAVNENITKSRIVNGYPASIHNIPYQAILYKDWRLHCGAAILSHYWLVSAAHCIVLAGDPSSLIARVGTGSIYSLKSPFYEISRAYIHASYDVNTFDNDISLIKLHAPIEFNELQKPIPIASSPPRPGDNILISGFGKRGEYRGVSQVLRATSVPVVGPGYCQSRYLQAGKPITKTMFCAGYGDYDACQGDSGGPAVKDGALVGIVSFGVGCGSPMFPGVYTRVDLFYDWIVRVTKYG